MLEHRLGFSLFERSRNGVLLTRAGERFLSEAAKGINHFDRAMQLAASASNGERGAIHLGIIASLNSGYLRELLIQFRRKHSDVDVVVHEATPQENLHSMIVGDLDIAFATGVPDVPGHLTELFWTEQVYVAMPRDHPLVAQAEIGWADIRHERFVVSDGGAGPEIHDYLVKRLSGLGFRPNVSIQPVGRESLLNLVGIGYGLSLVSTSSLGTRAVDVVIRPINDSNERLESSAIWSSRNSNPALRRLISVARAMRKFKAPRVNGAILLIFITYIGAMASEYRQLFDMLV